QAFEAVGGFPQVSHHECLLFFLNLSWACPGYPTEARTVLYRQTLRGKGRSKLTDYDTACRVYIHEVPQLKDRVSPEEYERLSIRQRTSLFYSFWMYGLIASARRYYPQLTVQQILAEPNKGSLALVSFKTGLHLLALARSVYQFTTRFLLAPWWFLTMGWMFK